MSTNERLEQALAQLQKRGCIVGRAALGPSGQMLIAVDGRMCTYAEIYEMLATEKDTTMSVINVKLQSESEIKRAVAAKAEIKGDELILTDKDGKEIGRFNNKVIEHWWVEPPPA